jgi:hypothetical protein
MRGLLPATLLLLLASLSSDAPRFRELAIPVGRGPRWIAIADVNRDGNPDILATNADSGSVSVFLGDGSGHFHPAPGSPFACGHEPNDIGIADMNGDGNLDLVIPNHQAPTITVLLGDGKGSFRPAPSSPTDVHSYPHPHGVAVADFNGDGHPDVVTDSWGNNQVELLIGDGAGGLKTPGQFFPTGHRPYERLRTADFNRDGHPDLVTTNLDDGTVSILLGDGHGGFHPAPGSPFPAGVKPWQVFVGDVTGDGIADLVVIPYQRDLTGEDQNVVSILKGDGRGGFMPLPGPKLDLHSCRGANSVTAGELQPGRFTIAVSCAESRNALLFERNAAGQFHSSSMPIKGGWGAIAIARLTDAGPGSLITANNEDATITIYTPIAP